MASKARYYSKVAIDKTLAEFRLIVGDRSIGKSYDVKYEGVEKGLKERRPFCLIRRWHTDLESGGAVGYFKDFVKPNEHPNVIERISDGEYNDVDFRAGEFTLIARNERGAVERRSHCVGYAVALTRSAHIKSRSYIIPCHFIFEEFITETYYLPKEVDLLYSVISTIGRDEFVPVYMIGNGLSRSCVYFREWGMRGVTRQKWGTIERYAVETNYNQAIRTIAIELSDIHDPAKKLKGRESKVTGASWYTHRIAQEPSVLKESTFHMVYKGNFTYLLTFKVYEGHNFGIFISPKTTDPQKSTRVVCSDIGGVDTRFRCSVAFRGLNERERRILDKHKHLIYFSDPLTAEDWTSEKVTM